MGQVAKVEEWKSSLGVILAVAGSAVGIGNFLRFPGMAAQYGGGAFMIAYFCSLILLGIPLAWMEWGIGRRGGSLGRHSSPSIYMLITQSRVWKYLGVLSIMSPLVTAMYYMFVEGWILGYAWHTMVGDLDLKASADYSNFFAGFAGLAEHGSNFDLSNSLVLVFFVVALIANIYLIYKGINKGIEWFCKWSMPALIITAIIIAVRVLTLGSPDASNPERSVSQGLGYMWNPDKVLLVDAQTDKTLAMVPPSYTPEQKAQQMARVVAAQPQATVVEREVSLVQGLLNPNLWIAAAGQLFFSLSIGFGTICTYASYQRKNKDIALSALSSTATNEVIEVGVAGMMIIPAAVSFLGVAAAAGASTFGLGFEVLPQVFAAMPAGQFFGTLFFSLLALAAVTSSISLLQPCVAFLEEFWHLTRAQSTLLVGTLLVIGALIVAWFTGEGLIALDTLDFFATTLVIYINCLFLMYIFRFVWKTDNGLRELERGAYMRMPYGIRFVLNWVTPSIMLAIFVSWLYKNIFETTCIQIQRVLDLELGAIVPLIWMLLVTFFLLLVARSSRHFHHYKQVESRAENTDDRIPIS